MFKHMYLKSKYVEAQFYVMLENLLHILDPTAHSCITESTVYKVHKCSPFCAGPGQWLLSAQFFSVTYLPLLLEE
jgi:hypothetical protein